MTRSFGDLEVGVHRAIALVVSAIFLVLLIATWRQPDTTWKIQIVVVVLFTVSAIRPVWGLLVFAGLFPLAEPLSLLTGGSALTEQMSLAFLSGAGGRLAIARDLRSSQLMLPALALMVLISASLLLQISAQQRAAEMLPFLGGSWRNVTGRSFTELWFEPFHTMLIWGQVLTVAIVAERILRSDPDAGRSVVRMLVLSAGALSVFSALRLAEISLGTERPFASALDFMWRLRFNPFYREGADCPPATRRS